MDAFYTATPALKALQITQLKTTAVGYTMNAGVEMHFARHASALGKPIAELESPEDALRPIFDLPLEVQVSVLLETFACIDEAS